VNTRVIEDFCLNAYKTSWYSDYLPTTSIIFSVVLIYIKNCIIDLHVCAEHTMRRSVLCQCSNRDDDEYRMCSL